MSAALVSMAACSVDDRAAVEAPRVDVARDTAEVRMLVAKTEQHPSLQDSSAAGKPLVLSATVRPRPPGVTMAMHAHHPEPKPETAAEAPRPHRQ